jgi:hypothetical protein
LPGTVGVTKGDSVVTTSVDLRSVVNVGDTVQLGSEEYEIVTTPDPISIILSRDYAEMTTNNVRISKCLFPSEIEDGGDGYQNKLGEYVVPKAIPLSTSLHLTKGSNDGVCNLRPDIGKFFLLVFFENFVLINNSFFCPFFFVSLFFLSLSRWCWYW